MSASTQMISPVEGLQVASELHRFLVEEALPRTGVDPERFWTGLADLVNRLGPRNRALLERRAELQAAIDRWYLDRRPAVGDGAAGTEAALDADAQRAFLEEIGYLEPPGPDFTIDASGIDAEIAIVAGPQLVVPVTNARYAINAANARWGSLYDAVYGTDVLGHPPPPGPYDPARGDRVVEWCRRFLDDVVPLADGSHGDVTAYRVAGGGLVADTGAGERALDDPACFAGHRGDPGAPDAVLFRHHGLHLELVVDREHPVGAVHPAGIRDVVLEAAVTTIADCEDSVATVDGADKALAYRNWLGLLTGELTAEVPAPGDGAETFVRRLAPDRSYRAPDGAELVLSGRSLLLVRNVGLLMTTPAVLDADGEEAFEGLVDALVTVLCATVGRNSRHGSVYVVKPKLHGPEEVAFAADTFAAVEDILGLPADTVKLGVMDEERRTTLNLRACIRAAATRLAFINTGFLDRTGDEIHTSMEAGPMVPKTSMKAERWLTAYEDANVDAGLACGLAGRAQIGKGMWAAPDRMAEMLETKIGHPGAGASCAWVPSPTAATLHATHYHRVDVAARQRELTDRLRSDGPRADLADLLDVPVLDDPAGLDDGAVQAELDNNAQGILGYVVRWVDQGVGCSKVPDINGVGLMEDRATCRISSQHLANWLHHGVVDVDRIETTLRAMAEVVDGQNAEDPGYRPLAPDFDGPAFAAARDLVLSGTEQPSGYTEPILHRRRRQRKALDR